MSVIRQRPKLANDELIEQMQKLVEIIKREFFLWQQANDVKKQVSQVLTSLENQAIVKQSKAGFWSIEETEAQAKIRSLSECAEATVQRLVYYQQFINSVSSYC